MCSCCAAWVLSYIKYTFTCVNAFDATDGPRAYSLAPVGTGEMYLSVAWDGACTINAPSLPAITPQAGGGQLIFKINEACTNGLWYSYISGSVDGGQLAVDFATGDIFGAVRGGAERRRGAANS